MANIGAQRLARTIRATAALRGKTLAAVGTAAGLSTFQFSRRLAGRPAFSVDELERVAKVLDTTASRLLGNDAPERATADAVTEGA